MPDHLPPPPDEAQRRRITDDLDHTLFVTAGAGSGKTKSLVDRVVALVIDGRIPITAIAAITFTEKAAAELADRVRRQFESVAAGPDQTRAVAAREALGDLDRAAIGTLHAFAQRLLMENPIDVGLPPAIEVLDEIASQVEFDVRWSSFVRRLFERALVDPALERSLLVFLASGAELDHLRALALLLGQNWDLVVARDALSHLPPVPNLVTDADTRQILDELAAATAHLAVAPEGDTMTRRLNEVEELRLALVDATDDVELVRALDTKVSFKVGNCGNSKSWRGGPELDELRARLPEIGPRLVAWRQSLLAEATDHLLAELGAFTVEAVEQRKASGRLEFHDLLVLARQLLTTDEGGGVRRRLHDRYQRLLLDEFQDTDPIQIELAVGIAADPAVDWPDSGRWQDLDVAPGRLFFVGDAKQSVYRFRRADIELYLAAQERFQADQVTLSANFRTVAPVLEWVNQVFGRVIEHKPGAQPEFQPLIPTRHESLSGSSVTVLGEEVHPGKPSADEVRRLEAADVAAVIRTALDEGWQVDQGGVRPARLDDITILLPTRAALEMIEGALDAEGLAFRAEASSLVYGTREVRDLLAIARAIDDPSDEISVVTALRSGAFGCSDRDLFRFKVELGGTFDHQSSRLRPAWQPQPDADPDDPTQQPLPDADPVVAGLRYLRRVHHERLWSSPSELLDRILRERRLMELGVGRGRARDVWRRLRFVVDQARAWAEAGGTNLREYLAWAALQGENDRATESVLPETDDLAVRIMTVHAAKGLEFPITVVAGSSTEPGGFSPTVRVAWTPDRLDYKIGANRIGLRTPGFTAAVEAEEILDQHERLRLLYVACTRARDHLVVSLHRTEAHENAKWQKRTNSALLLPGIADAEHWSFPAAAPPAVEAAIEGRPVHPDATPEEVASWVEAFERWRSDRRGRLAAAEVPRTWSATALAKAWLAEQAPAAGAVALAEAEPADPAAVDDAPAEVDPGLEKEPPDLELPPWNKGRYGTAVGRAVHAVLQTVDLAGAVGASVGQDPDSVLTPEAAEAFRAAVASQAAGEGVAHLEGLVVQLAWSALTSERVARAVAAPQRWREVYVGTPIDGHPVEGYLDLLYRIGERYVVVDYKTDSVADAHDRAALLDRYRGQGATYALAVEAITGSTVDACVFLLLSPGGASEVVLDGDALARAKDEVRAILAGQSVVRPMGQETPVPPSPQ